MIMIPKPSNNHFSLRPATALDARDIRNIIHQVNINPTGLSWRRFTLAMDEQDQLIGCGQVKEHKDGSPELASIAVLPEWRGKGVARRIIEHLLEQHPGRLYLTCRAPLVGLYQRFGFEVIEYEEMPAYFQRIKKLVEVYSRLSHQPSQLRVMRRG